MATSDNASLKSSLSSSREPKTPTSIGPSGRKVGFSRPTLIIPPPNVHYIIPNPYSAKLTMTAPTPEMYSRKASQYVFQQFQGMMTHAKTGLGAGEKCAYWLYNKLKIWSRKWFTHFFLTIVLVLYTVGGALSFIALEGPYENLVYELDIRTERYAFIGELTQLTKQFPHENETQTWIDTVEPKMRDFLSDVILSHQKKRFIRANRGHTVWTMWNAVVFCTTIYSTIASMDSTITSTEFKKSENDSENADNKIDMARIEAMLTPEQVLSDSVARKRRKFTKKRGDSIPKRESTPIRNLDDKIATTSDEEIPENRPKTPERRKFKRNKIPNLSPHRKSFAEHDVQREKVTINGNNKDVSRNSSVTTSKSDQNETEAPPKYIKDKRESLSDLAQAEILSLFNKTKKSITNAAVRGRAKFRKTEKELVKRSQSAPHQFTEEELIESFRKAQLLSATTDEPQNLTVRENFSQNKSLRRRNYSDTSLRSLTPDIPFEPKPLRPEVQEFVRQRKKSRQYVASEKIVEILDPKTSNVIATKAFVHSDFKFKHFFSTLRIFSCLEIYRNYKIYKLEMHKEYGLIKKLWIKCMCEVFLILVFCGFGGFIFKFVEGRFENYYKCGVKKIRRDFVDLLWMKSHNLREEDWKSLARNRLRTFEEELHVAHEAGMTSYSGQRSWGFLNGVVYALTIITTIGYGNMSPKTLEGRILTIVYALIGIPLFLIALTDFGKLFTRYIKFLWSYVRRLYYTGSCRSMRKTVHVQEIFKGAQMMYDIATFRRPSEFVDPENPQVVAGVHTPGTLTSDGTPTTPAISVFEIDDEFNLPISVALFILVSYIFCGAVMYMMVEKWGFFESFYFVFISMSTIGFGDYVPQVPGFTIVSILYLVFGLALMSMCINVVQAKLSDTFKRASAKIGATMGLQVDEDGSIITVPPENVEIPEVHDTNKLSPQTPNSLSVNSIDLHVKDQNT